MSHNVHRVNAFALHMTLMVMVKIKHCDPDSAANAWLLQGENKGGVSFLLFPWFLVEPSLHGDRSLPGERKEHL